MKLAQIGRNAKHTLLARVYLYAVILITLAALAPTIVFALNTSNYIALGFMLALWAVDFYYFYKIVSHYNKIIPETNPTSSSYQPMSRGVTEVYPEEEYTEEEYTEEE